MESILIITATIVFSSLLTITFKYFQKFNIETSNAIVINYLVAGTLAFIFSGSVPSVSSLFSYDWAWAAIGLAFLFITLFNLLAVTSQKIGVTQANVANKTTFIFPVLVGICFFNEEVNAIKIIGFLCAFAAVFAATKEKSKRAVEKHSNFALIVLLFLGGGLLDMLLGFTTEKLISPGESSLFSGYSFFIAGVFGFLFWVYSKLCSKVVPVSKTDILGGLVLGCINYFSIYTFLESLALETVESSVVFTVVNMGIIVCASLLSAALFKETLTKQKILSIVLAIFAILLVSFSHKFLF